MQEADKAREKGQVRGMAAAKKAVEGASRPSCASTVRLLTAFADFGTLVSSLTDPAATE